MMFSKETTHICVSRFDPEEARCDTNIHLTRILYPLACVFLVFKKYGRCHIIHDKLPRNVISRSVALIGAVLTHFFPLHAGEVDPLKACNLFDYSYWHIRPHSHTVHNPRIAVHLHRRVVFVPQGHFRDIRCIKRLNKAILCVHVHR